MEDSDLVRALVLVNNCHVSRAAVGQSMLAVSLLANQSTQVIRNIEAILMLDESGDFRTLIENYRTHVYQRQPISYFIDISELRDYMSKAINNQDYRYICQLYTQYVTQIGEKVSYTDKSKDYLVFPNYAFDLGYYCHSYILTQEFYDSIPEVSETKLVQLYGMMLWGAICVQTEQLQHIYSERKRLFQDFMLSSYSVLLAEHARKIYSEDSVSMLYKLETGLLDYPDFSYHVLGWDRIFYMNRLKVLLTTDNSGVRVVEDSSLDFKILRSVASKNWIKLKVLMPAYIERYERDSLDKKLSLLYRNVLFFVCRNIRLSAEKDPNMVKIISYLCKIFYPYPVHDLLTDMIIQLRDTPVLIDYMLSIKKYRFSKGWMIQTVMEECNFLVFKRMVELVGVAEVSRRGFYTYVPFRNDVCEDIPFLIGLKPVSGFFPILFASDEILQGLMFEDLGIQISPFLSLGFFLYSFIKLDPHPVYSKNRKIYTDEEKLDWNIKYRIDLVYKTIIQKSPDLTIERPDALYEVAKRHSPTPISMRNLVYTRNLVFESLIPEQYHQWWLAEYHQWRPAEY